MKRRFGQVNNSFNSLNNLLTQILLKSRETNTLKNYSIYFEKWNKWASEFPDIMVIPAQEFHVVLYLIHLFQTGSSYPVIRTTHYAINFFHTIAGYSKPCDSSFSTNILEGIKRIKGHKVQKKDPITVKHLHKLFRSFGGKNMDLTNLRTMTMCVLGFMGFLRFSEIANIKCHDVIIYSTHLALFIEKSKTDVYRDGSWVYLTKLESELCPIKLLNKYMKATNSKQHSDKFLFRAILKTQKCIKLRKANKPISYSRIRDLLLEALQEIGLSSKHFGLHSLRSGGATAAANLGVKDRLFKKHGRWKSENIKDSYVHENIQEKLLVTRNLGF